MKLSRTYKRDKTTGELVETTPENVKAILKGMPKRRKVKIKASAPTRLAKPVWPRPSDALSVRPKARVATMKMLSEAGIPTEILPDGRFNVESRGHQNRLLKFYGWRNNAAGYGDHAGR